MANVNATRFFDVCNLQDVYEMKYNNALCVKVGRATIHVAEAQWLYENTHYVLTCNSVYQICYSVNAGYYAIRLHYMKGASYCKRGRFHTGDARFINDILGVELLADPTQDEPKADEPKADEPTADVETVAPKADNEPKDEPKDETTADVEDLETVALIRMYKVLRKADGTIKTKFVRRWSRFSIAYNSLKDNAEMAREKGINVQKVGAQYFVVNPSFGEGVVLMLYVCRGEIDEKKAARIINKALPQLQTADPTTDAPKADNEPKDAPTADDPRKAGTFQDCNETDVISYFAELGLNVADGFYTDFVGRWSYTVGKEDPTAEINVPLTTGEYINLSKAA